MYIVNSEVSSKQTAILESHLFRMLIPPVF